MTFLKYAFVSAVLIYLGITALMVTFQRQLQYFPAQKAVLPQALGLKSVAVVPLTAADGRPYAGCYVIANVELWAQDNNYGKRINASLRGVQFLRDGDAFSGGGAASEDEFDEVEGSDAGDLV